MSPMDELQLLLRPAGAGLHTVSTGRREQEALQRRLYAVGTNAEVLGAWKGDLARLAVARVLVLGVPSDTGAGLVRGAAFGPQALRDGVLRQDPSFPAWMRTHGVLDLGDVAVVPQLLHDDMLSVSQKQLCQASLFPDLSPDQSVDLPVSPLSIVERVLDLVLAINPPAKIFVLGGDHSVAWPVVAALHRHHAPLGIVQPDAHTDLLPSRLGIRLCFATWAYHANDLIGRKGRLVQVGIRASGRDQAHWESTLGVRQFWAQDLMTMGPDAACTAICAHLDQVGIRNVYFSNDIDGTDAQQAPATGAPEPNGLDADFVRQLIETLGRRFNVVGADLVEVAPPVGDDAGSRRTIEVGASYVLASLRSMLQSAAP